MEKILEIISAVPLFNGLSDDQLNEIKNIAVSKHFNKGETVFLEGDPGNGFYVVAEGLVKIYKVSAEG
ncbi:MAG: cyclic nucleotide-binding domain-containing protein, partial [Proteobacteria bacterium]|nr:cyclic nucleotide-binding domain-containing protein [Pseudomonadota bacterium]